MNDSRVEFAKVFSTVLYVLMGIGLLVNAFIFNKLWYVFVIGGAFAELIFIVFTQLIISLAENAADANGRLYTICNKIEQIERNNSAANSAPISDTYRAPAGNNQSGFRNLVASSSNVGLSGMWKCRKCGETNPASSVHCQSCGEDR